MEKPTKLWWESLSLGHKGQTPLPASLLIPFVLPLTAASTDASTAFCVPSTDWDVAWILTLLLTVGQGFTIVVLGVMLWRQRAQGVQHRSESLLPRGVDSDLASLRFFSRGEGGVRKTALSHLVTSLLHLIGLFLSRCLISSVQTRDPGL